MYFRFTLALIAVIAVALIGVKIDQHNRTLQQELTTHQEQEEQLSQHLNSTRAKAIQSGVSPQQLDDIEDGELELPSPENPSQVVRSKERDLQ